MKGNNDIDIENSLKYREGWHEDGIERYSRPERTIYLSELPDGTLAGTEKMTRADYALKQKHIRMAIDRHPKGHIEGLYFCESHAAVAYRVKVGMLKAERQYGTWVVWEEAGPRREGSKGPYGKKGSKD